jgi:hypothetical protein
MLQPITKKFFFAAAMLALVSVFAMNASAQAPGTPADSSSTAPSSSTPAGGQTTVAAPGTVAITPQNALALAAPYTGPKYTNRFEVYAGLQLMNGQAGQNTPVRYNMGGMEGMFTYWLGPNLFGGHVKKLGLAADYRFGAGTTPVISPYYNRVVIMQSIQSGGLVYRGPKNRYAAIDFHALAGGTYGIFNYAVNHYPAPGSPVAACSAQETATQDGTLGLYCNHMAPYGAIGGSIDFNQGAKVAIRLSPDMTFEHFGTETREFFAISLGALYRFGKK